eukprot:m.52914 g.52914  ORF g.52914 m.52914 type:complete len:121 (-) comp11340_c0_seq8:180-542(-)
MIVQTRRLAPVKKIFSCLFYYFLLRRGRGRDRFFFTFNVSQFNLAYTHTYSASFLFPLLVQTSVFCCGLCVRMDCSGKVYEALYDMAHREPLNQAEVAEGFKKHLQPLMKASRLMFSSKL